LSLALALGVTRSWHFLSLIAIIGTTAPATSGGYSREEKVVTQRDVSEWAVGWTWFAAVMMWLIGGFHAIAGLVAIIDDEFYVVTRDYIFQFDATAWGWIHLIAGVIVVLAGVYLLSGAVWARIIGVILAVVSILVNFAWLPWSPLWSIIMITANVFVIWALTVHGRDAETVRAA